MLRFWSLQITSLIPMRLKSKFKADQQNFEYPSIPTTIFRGGNRSDLMFFQKTWKPFQCFFKFLDFKKTKSHHVCLTRTLTKHLCIGVHQRVIISFKSFYNLCASPGIYFSKKSFLVKILLFKFVNFSNFELFFPTLQHWHMLLRSCRRSYKHFAHLCEV